MTSPTTGNLSIGSTMTASKDMPISVIAGCAKCVSREVCKVHVFSNFESQVVVLAQHRHDDSYGLSYIIWIVLSNDDLSCFECRSITG